MNPRLRLTIEEIIRNLRSPTFVPPVQNLTDIDFYKFTMGQFIHKFYPDDIVTFKLIVRDKKIRLWQYVDLDDLQKSFEYVAGLSFRKTDFYYLRGMDLYDKHLFGEDYLSFLRTLKLSGFKIERTDGGVEITFTARWCEVSLWETIAMAIISELYYRGIMKRLSDDEIRSLYVVADNRLKNKLHALKQQGLIRFADFGQRRRNGFLWQKYVIGEAALVLKDQFIGTSNTWMAFKFDLNAIGTGAHELPMTVTALANSDDEMRYAQYKVLEQWQELYGQGLRIMLPDTYGSEQFFANAPAWLTSWRGQRQDSGDPVVEGERYMSWLRMHGVDPKERLTIFSDGLDIDPMKAIHEHFNGQHLVSYGWGTLFTNDVQGAIPGDENYRPFSMACKVVSVNGRPCVKLSNDTSKATGPKDEIARYMRIFGEQHRVTRDTIV